MCNNFTGIEYSLKSCNCSQRSLKFHSNPIEVTES